MPVLLLQHGGLTSLTGKTGLAMLRHRRGPIAAVIDPAHAHGSLAEITGIDRTVPIVPDLAAALPYRPAVAVVSEQMSCGSKAPSRSLWSNLIGSILDCGLAAPPHWRTNKNLVTSNANCAMFMG